MDDLIFYQQCISLNRNDGMPCNASLPSVKSVERCPRNDLELKARAAYVNCSSVEQSCVESDMFLYHCVLNAEGTKRIEVCAPVKSIHGKCINQKPFAEKCFFSQHVGNFSLHACPISRKTNVDCSNKQRILVLVEGC